jgi:capsular polysaccharide biosynthesis protein
MNSDDRFDSPRDRETQVLPRSIGRRVAGHWRGILLLWLLLATPVAYLIYNLVDPIYEAFSLLQVQPAHQNLFVAVSNDSTDRMVALPYLETQVQLIGSDRVLDAALSRPGSTTTPAIAKLPMIVRSKDPKADLRKMMQVEIVKDTFLIRIALASRDPEETAPIVNSVVESYLEQHSEYHRAANKVLNKSLEEEVASLATKIDDKNRELQALIETGHIAMNRPMVKPNAAAKGDDTATPPALAAVTEEQYTKVTDKLIQADLELIDARARLEAAKVAGRGQAQAKPADATRPRPIEGSSSMAPEDKLHELEAAVEEAKRKRIGYAQYIMSLNVLIKPQNSNHVAANLVNQELASLLKMKDIISQRLEQLRFENKQDVYRVSRHDAAQVPKVPASSMRPIYMSVASLGILVLVLGFFLTLEIRARRPVGTDETETSTPPTA